MRLHHLHLFLLIASILAAVGLTRQLRLQKLLAAAAAAAAAVAVVAAVVLVAAAAACCHPIIVMLHHWLLLADYAYPTGITVAMFCED